MNHTFAYKPGTPSLEVLLRTSESSSTAPPTRPDVDVSHWHSKALSETTGIDLVLVDGGSHGLGKPTADGTLFAILLDRLHIHRKHRKGSQRDARLPKDVFLLRLDGRRRGAAARRVMPSPLGRVQTWALRLLSRRVVLPARRPA